MRLKWHKFGNKHYLNSIEDDQEDIELYYAVVPRLHGWEVRGTGEESEVFHTLEAAIEFAESEATKAGYTVERR